MTELSVVFDPEDRKLITDIIDIWVAGAVEAKQLTTEDPTIESAEELLDLMSGYDDDLARLNKIRQRLNPKEAVPHTKDENIQFRKDWDERYERGERNRHG